jgi:hypothetical protein
MQFRLENNLLAWVLAGWASGVAAQEDCQNRIAKIETVGDIRAALSCVQGQILTEAERVRDHAERTKDQLLQQTVVQTADHIELVTTKVRQVALKDSTNGVWKPIPDATDARACFLTAVRLPAQGLCQVAYQGDLKRWAYSVSDPASAGFTCTTTCIWLEVRRKAQTDK